MQFSAGNINGTWSGAWRLVNTNCVPPFFFPQFTGDLIVEGTGEFATPPSAVTGTGSSSFTIGADSLSSTLTVATSSDGQVVNATERIQNATRNCFGEFQAALMRQTGM